MIRRKGLDGHDDGAFVSTMPLEERKRIFQRAKGLDTTRDAEGPVLDVRPMRSARGRAIDRLMRETRGGRESHTL